MLNLLSKISYPLLTLHRQNCGLENADVGLETGYAIGGRKETSFPPIFFKLYRILKNFLFLILHFMQTIARKKIKKKYGENWLELVRRKANWKLIYKKLKPRKPKPAKV